MINRIKYKKLPKHLRERWSYDDYLAYRMQEMSIDQIESVATPEELWECEKVLNDDAFRDIFNDKQRFYEKFHIDAQGKYIGRGILFLPGASEQELHDFCIRHERVVIKPPDMYAGIGICVTDGETAFGKLINELRNGSGGCSSQRYVVEEYVNQADEYNRIYPSSLNTVRVTTFIGDDGKPGILFAVNQFGQRGSLVDNDDDTSIWSAIDTESGIVVAADIDDKSGFIYDMHPDTGVKIVGFRNPMWERIRELALELAMVVPECRLVGWDIAVTEDYSLELIEGNVTPELDLYQRISGNGLRYRLGM